MGTPEMCRLTCVVFLQVRSLRQESQQAELIQFSTEAPTSERELQNQSRTPVIRLNDFKGHSVISCNLSGVIQVPLARNSDSCSGFLLKVRVTWVANHRMTCSSTVLGLPDSEGVLTRSFMLKSPGTMNASRAPTCSRHTMRSWTDARSAFLVLHPGCCLILPSPMGPHQFCRGGRASP